MYHPARDCCSHASGEPNSLQRSVSCGLARKLRCRYIQRVRYPKTLFALLCVAACAPEIPYEPAPDVVRALWNPTTGTLPTPTNLVRTNGQLDLPLGAELSAAELEFRAYLNSLDGYPLSSTLTIPMSAAVSEAGLPGSVVVIDTETGESITVNPSVDGDRIVAKQRLDETNDGWQPGHTYAFGLRGYAGGVRGAGGAQVVADAPFYLIRTDEDLRDHPYAMPGESRHEKAETAERLEEVRQRFLPLYDAMGQRGVPREEIAVVSEFTTTGRPAFWFDADRRIVPVPNGLLVDSVTGLVEIPIDDEDDATTAHIKTAISEYDGSATTAALTFEATGAFDAATVSAQNVRLLRIDSDGTVSEELQLEYGVRDDRSLGYIQPLQPLRHSANYVLVATRAVTAGGLPLEPQPISVFLRLKAPLVVDGVSQLGSLNDATATYIDTWRERAEPALDWLETQGTRRADLSLIAPFRTMSTTEALLALRAKLYDDNAPTNVTNVQSRTPLQLGVPLFAVDSIVTGTFEIQDYLDPRTRNWRPDAPQATLVDFVLTIPDGATAGQPLPTVLFGHGLFTSRELVYFIADQLSRAGFAVFSFDLPYHGRRSACLRDEDCTGDGTCDEFGACSTEFATISSPFPDGPEYPAATGSAFIETGNIVGARDHFRQSAVDMFQALRVIRGADWASATGGYTLNGDDVVYMGMSLGGILGSIVAGAEPTITDFVLNVPGGDLFVVFRDSTAFTTAFEGVLEERMAEPGTDDYFALENALRWMLDNVDPVNVAPDAMRSYAWTDPVDGVEKMTPVKRVLIQMAVGDSVVPNSSTRRLSDAMGVPIREYTPLISNHVFLFDPTSLEGGRARRDAVEFLEQR